MSDTLFDLSQYQSQAQISYNPDWRDATGTDPAWEQPDRELDLGANSQSPDGDAPTGWQSASEFTLTLQSGQTVEVTFVPCLVGKRRMHEFSFTGPVSPTGFKSHFVLAAESEQFPHPRDYAQAYAESLMAQLEEKHKVLNKKQCRQKSQAPSGSRDIQGEKAPQALQELTADHDNFTIEPTMAENETTDSSHTPVEVVEELSPEEESDRQRLELKVERAFYEAGCSLRELRERRLYRSMHKTFDQYCRIRFGFTYRHGNQLIAGSLVIENLQMGTNRSQFLPTKLEQVKPLTTLEPDEQRQVWDEAIKAAGGRIPSGRLVKDAVLRHIGIVDGPNQKNSSPPELAPGDVVEIKALKLEPLHPFNGMWAVIEHIGSFSYTVRISIARDTQQCKAEELTLIDEEYTADIKAVAQRIGVWSKPVGKGSSQFAKKYGSVLKDF